VFLLAFAAVLIGFCVWVYYYFTLPYLFPSLSVGLVLNFAVSVWLLSNLVFNYVTAVTTSAGEPPKAPVRSSAGLFVASDFALVRSPMQQRHRSKHHPAQRYVASVCAAAAPPPPPHL